MRRFVFVLWWWCCCLARVASAIEAKKTSASTIRGSSSEGSKKVGCLIVGLGGANGVTVLAALVANRRSLSWEGSKRKCEADWTGCVTQSEESRESLGCAGFENAEVGGWDLRSTKLGEALVDARILDHDLARQVREDLNEMDVWPGVWDPEYIGESQHATATWVVEDAKSPYEKIEHLRRDIRAFKRKVDGHTTVVWSASVEANSDLDPEETSTAARLMDTVRNPEKKVPPSLMYAVAAALEKCSFVNGGSQDTCCPGLLELFENSGGYCLGTDFKAGQTKFKSAAVEYLEALALRVKVVASSNHLGNNDMYNLMGKRQRDAKLRVKNDVFPAGSVEKHTVSVQYTPYIGDEKRDVVEYTSEAFLSQLHTMLTYTRCSDSVLCAPLIVDACVWCDAFARNHVPPREVRKALAYLFKVPNAPTNKFFFFEQLRDLEQVCQKYLHTSVPTTTSTTTETTTVVQPIGGKVVVCFGIACLDVELDRAKVPSSLESITAFRGTTERAGGSSPQTATALSRLGLRSVVVANVGNDMPGIRLKGLLQDNGVELLSPTTAATGMAVVPVFESGGRGCFFDPGDNKILCPNDLENALDALENVTALHIGYPHLLPSLQGCNLAGALERAKRRKELLVSLDLNGVQPSHRLGDAVLNQNSTSLVDVLHANAEEAATLLGKRKKTKVSLEDLARELSEQSRAALVTITDGANGAVLVAANATRLSHSALPLSWESTLVRVPAFTAEGSVNANGAGDAFCAGLIAGILHAKWDTPLSLETVGHLASLTAFQRITQAPPKPVEDLLSKIL